MKYKVGDRVRIKSLDWYNQMLSIPSKIVGKGDFVGIECGTNIFTKDMSKFCGRVMTIQDIGIDFYIMEDDMLGYEFTDEMIECKVEEETESKFKVGDKVILDPYPCKITDVQWRDGYGFVYTVRGTDFGMTVKEDELIFDEMPTPTTDEIVKNIKADWNNFKSRYNLPNDYHFVDKSGNEINISEIVLEKKKPKYPKTYEECENILGLEDSIIEGCLGYEYKLLNIFQKLLMCRDAYWKIAGEEMGLGKPWKPDWEDYEHKKFVFVVEGNTLIEKEYSIQRCTLAFPTEEMRDAFYDNFKEEIEICKDLL